MTKKATNRNELQEEEEKEEEEEEEEEEEGKIRLLQGGTSARLPVTLASFMHNLRLIRRFI